MSNFSPSNVSAAVRSSLAAMPGVLPLVGAHEIGQLLGVGRARVAQLVNDTDFPEPVAVLQLGRVWLREDVEQWAREQPRRLYPLDADE